MRPLLTLVVVGCSSSATVPAARFANTPPVGVVDDRRDVPRRPAARPYMRARDNFLGQIAQPIDRALALDTPRRALGTSSIDEVPDSTWFTNRIGVREIPPDELRASPVGIGNPEAHTPWTIHSTKVGGMSPGFIVTDARGVRFQVKFDMRGIPEAETAAQVIAGKLLWACGYNVTEDYVAYVRRDDLVLAPDAVSQDGGGKKTRLDRVAFDRTLQLIDIGTNGRIRTMVSRILDGELLGGHPVKGTRRDDPNDRIPHERRRDLRGAAAIFTWLDHVDVQPGQFLDTWVADRTDPRRHYVKHYVVDYGLSLGVMALVTNNVRRSYEYYIDWRAMLSSFFTLGMWPQAWEPRRAPEIRGVGIYETATFAPGAWRPASPLYVPFVDADRFDNFWATKILMRFTREQLRAAVEAGRLTDRRATDYLTNALVARQRAMGAHWFSRVNPLDNFAATAGGLCFDDLALVHRFASPAATTYVLQRHDRAGRAVGRGLAVHPDAARTCTPIDLAPGRDGYTIVRVSTTRASFRGSTYVHLAREPETGTPRVIGLWRE